MDPSVRRYVGARRGIFGLDSWAPVRAPGQSESDAPTYAFSPDDKQSMKSSRSTVTQSEQPPHVQPRQQFDVQSSVSEQPTAKSAADNSNAHKPPTVPSASQRLVAKYTFVATVDSPLGKNAELNLSQFDRMTMIHPHPTQEFWWFVEMDDGRRGYVPANYVMPFEEKVTSLPWLANHTVEPLPPVSSQPYKPYKSAYSNNNDTAPANRQYFCEVCQKQLNGPQPYSAHMNSRAHREEVELASLA